MEDTPEKDELLTVVVPALNEEEGVTPTVEEIMELAPSLPVRVEVVLVNDGSTDRTGEVMAALCEKYPDSVRVITNERCLGAGEAALRAFETIDEESWVTCFPGDNEMVFRSIEGFLEVRRDYDLILGYLQNPIIRPLLRRVGSSCFMIVTRFLYGYPYRYLNGIKMYRMWVFKNIDTVSRGHAINAELIAKAMLKHTGLRVGEAPFVAKGRARGKSKAFKFSAIFRAMRETWSGYRSVVRYREEAIREGR